MGDRLGILFVTYIHDPFHNHIKFHGLGFGIFREFPGQRQKDEVGYQRTVKGCKERDRHAFADFAGFSILLSTLMSPMIVPIKPKAGAILPGFQGY